MGSPALSLAPPAAARPPVAATAGDVFVFPASFAQQRLWFVDQYNPGSTAYCLPILLRVAGNLNPNVLERVLNEIVRRHEILRTTFSLRQWELVQVISPEARLTLPLVDLSPLPEPEREARAFELAREESRRAFDLRQGPLFRAHLWRLCDRDHLFLLDMHHIVADGWSFSVLLHELAVLYQAFAQGRDSPLPEPILQYADFAQWQRDRMKGSALEEHLSFWKTALAEAPPVLDLRTDRPRPARQTFHGAYETELLPAGLTERIKALSRREGCTPFMTLLAAFFALLYRHTGQTDMVVGSPIANRSRVELEPLIGLFMNTLVLRADVSGNPTFRELLARVGRTCVDAYAYQEMPFEKLVEELQPPRDPGRNPVFQITFVHQRAFIQPFGAGDIQFTPIKVDRGGALADFSLVVIERDEGFTAGLEYNTDLFDLCTMRRMLGHLRTLLLAVVEDPTLRIDALPLLTNAERRQILVEWNRTEADFTRAKCLHQLFEEQVEKTPDAIAVISDGKALTYREVNARSNRLARRLVGLGVRPETRVALCMERSAEMVVGLIGILKSGGAWVPLDPSYPRQRAAFMLEDTETRVVLTQKSVLERLPPGDFHRLALDEDWAQIERECGENLSGEATAENLAYVIYTSGSTGNPKGVEISHAAIGNHMFWMQEAFPLTPEDRVLQKTPIGFDASVWEFFAPLLAGACLVIARPQDHRDPAALVETISRNAITVLQVVPSLLRMLLDQEGFRGCTSLRRVFCGGEPLPRELQERFFAALGSELHNLYGPTEASIDATSWTCRREDSRAVVPIGRPIANMQAYVLDTRGRPVPIGVAGELHLGGRGLARGYLNRPELTTQNFLPNPFVEESGARIYRTGDLARWLPDGTLEYLGRLDRQVKLRGFRIELGEVEAVLGEHPEVASAVVIAREDLPGDRRLVSYVVRRDGKRAPIPGLRDSVAAKLPDYMVPSAFVVLGSFPLSANGKLDWAALPPPGVERSELGARGSLPQDTLELLLLKTWEDVLGVRPVGVRDNFFELGGHSLLAVRLFIEIEKTFGCNLPLATLFQAPTVERLSAKLREEGWEAPWSSLAVIQGGASGRAPFLCIPGVGGNILGFYDLARQLGPDQPVYGLQAQGLDGKREPLTRVEDMAAHYIEEIRAVLPDGPFLLGGASFGGRVAFEMARQLEPAGQPVALVALFDAFAPRAPATSVFPALRRDRLKSYIARLAYHLRNLLFVSERRRYVVRKSRTLRRRIRSRIWRMIYKFYRSRSKPLPRVLQNVREAGYLANREYAPGPYRGKVTLFRAGVRSAADAATADMGWSRLAQGGVEVREVPGDHVDMLLRPQVALLAEQLRHCIDEAIDRARPKRSTAGPRAAVAEPEKWTTGLLPSVVTPTAVRDESPHRLTP